MGVVLTHHRRGVRGQFHGAVIRIRWRDNDSGVHRGRRAGLGVAERGVGQALPVGAIVNADIDVDQYSVVIAGPDAVNRLVESRSGRTYLAVRIAVLMPRADEHVVDPLM